MLQKTDKDRLDKVLAVLKRYKFKFQLTTVATRLGYDRGIVSSWLNGKKPITDNFYNKFMAEFDADTNNTTAQEPPVEYGKTDDAFSLIKKMVENTSTLVETVSKNSDSIKNLTETNAIQTQMLRQLIAGDSEKTEPVLPASLADYQDKLIRGGIGKHWFDYDEGLAELNRLTFVPKVQPKRGIHRSAGTSDR